VAILTANDGTHGREVWRSDGTAAGTYQLGEICPATTARSLATSRTRTG
jgi:ELWxxDGT repeat protein